MRILGSGSTTLPASKGLVRCLRYVVLTLPLPTVLLLTFDDNAGGLLPVVDDLLVERLPRRHAVPQVRHLVLLQVLLNQRPTTTAIKPGVGGGTSPQGCSRPNNKSFLSRSPKTQFGITN